MGWESYNFLLFAKDNKAVITSDEYGERMLMFMIGN